MVKNMSKIGMTYFDPLTPGGVSLADGELFAPRLHECGVLKLDAGWNFSRVKSPFWRAYHNLDAGAAVRTTAGRTELAADRVVILPEGLAYDCLPRPGVRHFWIHFTPAPGDAKATDCPWVAQLDKAEGTLWRGLHERAMRCDAAELRRVCAALLWLAWARLPEAREGSGGEGSPRLRVLLDWLERRLDRPPGVAEMAARAGLGESGFLRWFARETGRTPGDYVTERRVREACRRLRYTWESIDEVAAATGFANRHHFSRVFKTRTGVTPAAYRRGIPSRNSGDERRIKEDGGD